MVFRPNSFIPEGPGFRFADLLSLDNMGSATSVFLDNIGSATPVYIDLVRICYYSSNWLSFANYFPDLFRTVRSINCL